MTRVKYNYGLDDLRYIKTNYELSNYLKDCWIILKSYLKNLRHEIFLLRNWKIRILLARWSLISFLLNKQIGNRCYNGILLKQKQSGWYKPFHMWLWRFREYLKAIGVTQNQSFQLKMKFLYILIKMITLNYPEV